MEEDACWVNGGERVPVCTNTATDRNGFSFGLVEEGGGEWGCLRIREELVGGSFDGEGVADGIWILGKGVHGIAL